MLPAKFEQIYLRLVWKSDTSPQSYQEILMEFSKLKGKGICFHLIYKINIHKMDSSYECTSLNVYNQCVYMSVR